MKNKQCKICGDKVAALGFCSKHYNRYHKYGDPYFTKFHEDHGNRKSHPLYASWQNLAGKRDPAWDSFQRFKNDVGDRPNKHILRKKDDSKVIGPNNFEWFQRGKQCRLCDKPVKAKGLCQTHYVRQQKHGDPTIVKKPSNWTGKSKHPLYLNWKETRKSIYESDESWSDFDFFVRDVGEKPKGAKLRRIDIKKPWGPDNFYWHKIGEVDTKEHRKIYGKKWRLKREFGLTLDQYEIMLEKQGGTCAICDQPPQDTGHVRSLCVDHDHDTGKIRELLCSNCNKALGSFKDSPTILKQAAAYLEKHGKT